MKAAKTAMQTQNVPTLSRIDNRPIVVTGIHRSGSTWVGNVIAKSSAVKYIHEPFNGMCPMGICAIKLPHTYMHLSQKNGLDFYPALNNMFQLKYDLAAGLKAADGFADYLRLAKHSALSLNDRVCKKVPLMKDPMAVLSTEWLAQTFGAAILILVRHPAAFVSSCYQLGWGFHFENFANQPVLMDTYFRDFKAEIEDYTQGSYDIIDKLSLLWKLIYSVVARYQQRYPNWLILRYEDICSNPVTNFDNIFRHCKLEKTAEVSAFIKESTGAAQPKNIFKNIHSIKRDTQKQVAIWKQRLSQAEIDRVRSRVESVSSIFYADADW